MELPPRPEVGRSQEIKLIFAAFSTPASVLSPLCLQRPPRSLLTYPFSLQSSRRGCWTDALPQDPILLWWKVEGAA